LERSRCLSKFNTLVCISVTVAFHMFQRCELFLHNPPYPLASSHSPPPEPSPHKIFQSNLSPLLLITVSNKALSAKTWLLDDVVFFQSIQKCRLQHSNLKMTHKFVLALCEFAITQCNFAF
jgi:hypothetical protein